MTEVYLIKIATSCDHILYLYRLKILLNEKALVCFTIASMDRCSCSKDVISPQNGFLVALYECVRVVVCLIIC
jgi:hypothetical protein